MFGPDFTTKERTYLQKAMPFGLRISYDYIREQYTITHKPPKARVSECLRVVKRETVLDWKRPERVINYVARRALIEAGYPAEVRVRD